MIHKGYQDLIYEIKMSSCQMQPNDALINFYIDMERIKDYIDADDDFSFNTKGIGEKQGSLSLFLLLIFPHGHQLSVKMRSIYTQYFFPSFF